MASEGPTHSYSNRGELVNSAQLGGPREIAPPKRLPDLAKSLGKGIAEFKKASEEVRKGIDEAVREAESEEKDSDPGPPPGDAPRSGVPPFAEGDTAPPPSAPKG